jgi:hypothetical protein
VPYTMSINQVNLAEGTDVFIPGLGTFKNGGEYDISDDQAEAFRLMYAVDMGGTISDPQHELHGSNVTDLKLGPSLTDVFVRGITFTEVKPPVPEVKEQVKTPAGPVAALSDSGAPKDKGDES